MPQVDLSRLFKSTPRCRHEGCLACSASTYGSIGHQIHLAKYLAGILWHFSISVLIVNMDTWTWTHYGCLSLSSITSDNWSNSVAKFRSLINSFKAPVSGTECYSLESFRVGLLVTARCDAERGYATVAYVVCPSVCDVQVPWPHRLKYMDNKFTAE